MPEVTPWRVLLVDDDLDLLRQVKEHLDLYKTKSDESIQTTTVSRFQDAFDLIESQRFDLLILDVFRGPVDTTTSTPDGRQVLQEIRSRRFLPVIFYTALPNAVEDLQSDIVRVVTKEGGFASLQKALSETFDLGLPQLNRKFSDHVSTVLRDFLWDLTPEHWKMITSAGDATDLAYILCRRLATSLDGRGAEKLAASLRKEPPSENTTIDQEHVHPMQYYIIPPVPGSMQCGDILSDRTSSEFFIVLTPSCDFAHKDKVDYALICQCHPLTEAEEYQQWVKNPSDAKLRTSLQNLMKSNPQKKQKDRFRFLPGALDLPDLIIDFQQSFAVSGKELDAFAKVASLDSPFRDGIVQQYSRFFSRIGFPDLDVEGMLAQMTRELGK